MQTPRTPGDYDVRMLPWKLNVYVRDTAYRCEYYIIYVYLQFDPEGFGEIPWPDFLQTLQNPDFIAQVPPHKREVNKFLITKKHIKNSRI